MRFVAPLVILLALSDYVLWRVAITRLRTAFDTISADMRSSGWTVASRPPEAAGWPFAATLLVGGVHVAGGNAALPDGVDWSSEWLRLSVTLLHPWRLAIAPRGAETLRISHLPPVVFWASHLQASFPFGRRPVRAALTAEALSGGLQNSRRTQDVGVGTLAVEGQAQESHGGVDAALDFTASRIGLPDTGRWPLGAVVKHLSATATLISPPVKGATGREEAQSWHDGLGFVRIHALNLRWGPLSLQGDAQFGLDGSLQPAGSGTLRVSGYAAALDALASAGVISPGLSATYKAILQVMSPSPSLKLPLTLHESTLSVGQIPLARVAELHW